MLRNWIIAAGLLSMIFPGGINAQTTASITINPNSKFQTIVGWEAEAQSGQTACSGFNTYKDAMFDQAVNDLGITRFRFGINTTTDTSSTFDMAKIDYKMDYVILPLRQRIMARGEKLWLNVNFGGKSGFLTDPTMQTYANEVLKVYQHLQQKYGILPDSWEIALEPGFVSPGWNTGAIMTEAIKKSSATLRANGFTNLYFIAPSSPCGATEAINLFNSMLSYNNGRLPPDMKEFAYHRYCSPSDTQLSQIANYRTSYGINTSQLEHGGANYTELHNDLKKAKVSAWEQYTLAFCANWDDGYQYYFVTGNTYAMSSQTPFLRQYFKYIRPGAVMIEANSTQSALDPVAFINKDGKYVVVINSTAVNGGSFSVSGLPAGTYGIFYTTYVEKDRQLPDQIISAGQTINSAIPHDGVITIYAKNASQSTPTSTIAPTNTPLPSQTATPTPVTIKPGDADGDGDADETDNNIWKTYYNTPHTGPMYGDFNGSGIVDGVDYIIWLNNY